MKTRLVALAVLVLSSQWVRTQEQLPAPKIEQAPLPAPKALEPGTYEPAIIVPHIVLVPHPDRPTPGRRSIWNTYALDSMGHPVPRVVYSPWGAYYQHNAAPYPVPQTRPSDWSRFISQ